MKKLIRFISVIVLIFITVVPIACKTNMSNSEAYKDNEQISKQINKYSTEYDHNFKLATKEIEQILYGKWQVGDAAGYSLKYDITGGALDYATIDISKNQLIINYSSKTFKDPFSKKYEKPVLAYYNETLEQMAKDDFLADYSGIEGIKPDTMGTVVVVLATTTHTENEYDLIWTKFIIIANKIIAVDMDSFFQLQMVSIPM